jgi:hypothetical protein
MNTYDEFLPNQLGKLVKKPTFKWVAELMNPIAVVTIINDNKKHRIVTNVTTVHKQIISYFGRYALQIYGLSKDLVCVNMKHYDGNYNCEKLISWCER